MKRAHQNAERGSDIHRAIKGLRDQTPKALQLCDLFEELADNLPNLSLPQWREAQNGCRSLLSPYFRGLNNVVIVELLRKYAEDLDRSELLARLQVDGIDQAHAVFDLEVLISEVLSGERPAHEPEVLGFALRGYFEPLRRNLYWHLSVLWPLAGRTWTNCRARHFTGS